MVVISFSLNVNTIYGTHIQLIILIMPNTIENEGENRVQKKGYCAYIKRDNEYLLIEKDFRYTVDEFSTQHFEMNSILKKNFYGGIPLRNILLIVKQYL